MHRAICVTGSVAIAALLWGPPAHARAADHLIRSAQSAPDGSSSADPVAPQANSPAQIRKAQAELKRLDCLKGRIDGHLGPRTRKAVNDYWAMAKQPAPAEVDITDALIAVLAERGDNYCRPARPFFSFGGRAGKFLPPFAPGARPGSVPDTAPKSPAAKAEQ